MKKKGKFQLKKTRRENNFLWVHPKHPTKRAGRRMQNFYGSGLDEEKKRKESSITTLEKKRGGWGENESSTDFSSLERREWALGQIFCFKETPRGRSRQGLTWESELESEDRAEKKGKSETNCLGKDVRCYTVGTPTTEVIRRNG